MIQGQIKQIRAIFLAIFVGIPALALGVVLLSHPANGAALFFPIEVAIAESGGFQPGNIQAQVGQKVTLKFHATDTIHSIAIGPGLGVDLGDIQPGQSKEITLTFDRPGTYTYYCNRFCSVNHWRMRGVIEVRDPTNSTPVIQRDPVIDSLAAAGINIDTTQSSLIAANVVSALYRKPSAERGRQIIQQLAVPPEMNEDNWRRTHTPQEALEVLTVANPSAANADLLDAVAFLWVGSISPDSLAQAATLFSKNCASCHGEAGGGDGLIATLTTKRPVAFNDPSLMLSLRADVLYAKIRRGGMGTDMPNFGTLITQEETWALVDYLWTLTFDPK